MLFYEKCFLFHLKSTFRYQERHVKTVMGKHGNGHVKNGLIRTWKCDGKGDTTLFSFWDFYLFELMFLFICLWFPNGLKPMRLSDFVINRIWNYKESDGRETKKQDFGNTFFILKFFKILEI